MGPIRSSIGIGTDTSVIHVSDFPDPTCGDIRYPWVMSALALTSAEMTPKVIPAGESASWLQTAEWISWMEARLNETQGYETRSR